MRTVKAQTLQNAVALSADTYSDPVLIDQIWAYAVQAVWTGASLRGTIKLQASIDGTTWSDVSNSSVAITTPADYLWNVTIAAYTYYRVAFIFTSGSGTLTTKIQNKGSN